VWGWLGHRVERLQIINPGPQNSQKSKVRIEDCRLESNQDGTEKNSQRSYLKIEGYYFLQHLQPGLPQREVPLGKLSKSSLQEREPLQQLSKRELWKLSRKGNLQKKRPYYFFILPLPPYFFYPYIYCITPLTQSKTNLQSEEYLQEQRRKL
jgi:hypothetical protein